MVPLNLTWMMKFGNYYALKCVITLPSLKSFINNLHYKFIFTNKYPL